MATLGDLNAALKTIDPHARAILTPTQWTGYKENNIVALHKHNILLEQVVPYQTDEEGNLTLTQKKLMNGEKIINMN